MSKVDTLFTEKSAVKPFEFDENVANVFDDMANRSIPFYQENQNRIHHMLSKKHSLQTVVDLGCSTGSLLLDMAERMDAKTIQLIGIDNSSAMIDKAKAKRQSLNPNIQVEFHCDDILNGNFPKADVIFLNYTLQFLPKEQRLDFLKTVHSKLNDGGLLFLSEKCEPHSNALGELFRGCYEEFKESNRYSKLEIARKRKALENRLVPDSIESHFERLKNAGFQDASLYLCWHHFTSFVALA